MERMALVDDPAADRAAVAIRRPGREHRIGDSRLSLLRWNPGRHPPLRASRRAVPVPGRLGMRATGDAVDVGPTGAAACANEERRAAAETAGVA